MLYQRPPRIAATLCAALALSCGGAAQAAGRHTYMLPPNDGYGIADCFSGDRGCARVVADAWCEAHGDAGAIAYGLAADATASITPPTASDAAAPASDLSAKGMVIITCGE
jgi:hypothetical protein